MFVRCLSVSAVVFWDHFLGHVNPYLVFESAVLLVFWVIVAQNEPTDLSYIDHVTQSLTSLSHILENLLWNADLRGHPYPAGSDLVNSPVQQSGENTTRRVNSWISCSQS